MRTRAYLAVIGVGLCVSALFGQEPAGSDALPKHALVRIGDSRFHGGGHRLRFSPDGKTLAVAENEKVRFVDVASGNERLVVRHLSKSQAKSTQATPQDVVEMVFLSGGKSLATVDFVGVLRIWSVADGAETRLPDTHPGVATLCASSDERNLFTAGFDGVLNEWQLPTGKNTQSWKAPGNEPILAIARFGKHVAGVTKEGILFHWDPATGKDTKRVDLGPVLLGITAPDFGTRKFPAKGSTSPTFVVYPRNVEFSPDGKRLAQIQGRQIWNVENGSVLANLTPSEPAVRLAFSHDNKNVVAAPTDIKGSIRLFDAASGTETQNRNVGKVEAVAFSPDGLTVAFAGSSRIRLWNHTKNEIVGGGDAVGAIKDWDISKDGKQIAIVTRDKLVRLYDARTGKHEESFPTDGKLAELVRYHPNGKTIMVGISFEGVLHFEKKESGWQAVQRFVIKEEAKGMTGDGPFMPFGNQMSHLLDAQTGKLSGGLAAKGKYSHFAYSPDGRHLLVAAEISAKAAGSSFAKTTKQYQLFAVPSMKLVRSIKAPARGFPEGRFSPDGRLILLDMEPVQILEVLSGTERTTLPIKLPRGAIDFAPDGKSLLVGTRDGAVLVLGLPKGQELFRTEKAHTTNVNSLRNVPGGKTISVAADQTIVVWSPELWKGRVPVGKLKLDPEDLDLFYQMLEKSDDANIGSAITTLISGGDATVGFLKTKLKPAASEDNEKPGVPPSASRLRSHRAIEVLEHIGTPAACELLDALSRGHANAIATAEAKETLARLPSSK